MKTKSLLKSLMDLLFRSFFARKYCASTSLLTVSENLLKYLALWQMTETRPFEYLPTTALCTRNLRSTKHHHHIFCKRAREQKMTLDFILCQSRKLSMKKVEMKNASLKAFQMTNLVQQQRRRGSRA